MSVTRSFIYIYIYIYQKQGIGPRTEPWGTPEVTSYGVN